MVINYEGGRIKITGLKKSVFHGGGDTNGMVDKNKLVSKG